MPITYFVHAPIESGAGLDLNKFNGHVLCILTTKNRRVPESELKTNVQGMLTGIPKRLLNSLNYSVELTNTEKVELHGRKKRDVMHRRDAAGNLVEISITDWEKPFRDQFPDLFTTRSP